MIATEYIPSVFYYKISAGVYLKICRQAPYKSILGLRAPNTIHVQNNNSHEWKKSRFIVSRMLYTLREPHNGKTDRIIDHENHIHYL